MDVQTNRGKFLNPQLRDAIPWDIGGYHDSDEKSNLLHVMLCRRVKIFRRFERILVTQNFIFCWPCISSQILVNNQPDALFRVFIYSFHLSTRFEHQVLIIRRLNCINTSSGMISLCDCLVCRSGIQSSHLHRLIVPDDVLIQFDLLMMSTWCSKHVERWNE
jgi:hypothetical protein